jgi:hypothetical protein
MVDQPGCIVMAMVSDSQSSKAALGLERHLLFRTHAFALVVVPDEAVRTKAFVRLLVEDLAVLALGLVVMLISVQLVVVVSTRNGDCRDMAESEETDSD